MSSRTDLLLWAQRIIALSGSPAHQLLEIKADDGVDQATEAFHRIARTSHPDLHRSGLAADELELVTLAYSRIAGAYQDFRSQRAQTTRMRPMQNTPAGGEKSPAAGAPKPSSGAPSATQGTGSGATSSAMNSKALIYYRKAELALRRGDLKGALLQMKMAIAGDPQSKVLRTALAEIEAELAKP